MGNKVLPYKAQLVKMLGRNRVFFDEDVRGLYSRDLSNPPKLIDLMLKRTPDCVVVPGTVEHLQELMKWAQATGVPLTPRAGGTSAYGGSVPARGGVSVDLRSFSRRIEVDAEAATVTVDPGVRIWDLESELNKHGLMLRVYPTSAPIATIGGFVCQGGVGMGSAHDGPVRNQVRSVQVVLPNGDVRRFAGSELDVVNEAMGITGVVTEITLDVAKLEEKVPVLVTYKTSTELAAGIHAFMDTHAWNVTFHNPTFSELREEAGGPKTVPKKKFSILAVYKRPAYEREEAKIAEAIESSGGQRLEDEVAAADWGEIFNTLRAKTLGPSIAPGEVVVPAEALADLLDQVENEFAHADVSIEGTLIQGGYVTILAFALEDERRMEYPLGFSLGVRLLDIGKSYGGRAYSPGLYLASEAPRVFGGPRYDRLVDFKRAVDGSRVMNPGKIIGIPPRGAPSFTPPFLNVDRQLNAAPAKFMMAKMAPLMRYFRPDEDRAAGVAQREALVSISGGGFGQKWGFKVYSANHSGLCACRSPLAAAVGHEAGTSQGLLCWAKQYIEGNFHPTDYSAELIAAAAEVEWDGDDSCPSGIAMRELARDLKAQLEADYGTTIEVSDALRARIDAARDAAAAPEPSTGDDGGDGGDDEPEPQADTAPEAQTQQAPA